MENVWKICTTDDSFRKRIAIDCSLARNLCTSTFDFVAAAVVGKLFRLIRVGIPEDFVVEQHLPKFE